MWKRWDKRETHCAHPSCWLSISVITGVSHHMPRSHGLWVEKGIFIQKYVFEDLGFFYLIKCTESSSHKKECWEKAPISTEFIYFTVIFIIWEERTTSRLSLFNEVSGGKLEWTGLSDSVLPDPGGVHPKSQEWSFVIWLSFYKI